MRICLFFYRSSLLCFAPPRSFRSPGGFPAFSFHRETLTTTPALIFVALPFADCAPSDDIFAPCLVPARMEDQSSAGPTGSRGGPFRRFLPNRPPLPAPSMMDLPFLAPVFLVPPGRRYPTQHFLFPNPLCFSKTTAAFATIQYACSPPPGY